MSMTSFAGFCWFLNFDCFIALGRELDRQG